MSDQPQSGSVTSKSGHIKVTGKIVTGINIEGAASDDVLKAAVEAMKSLNTGQVSAALGIEAGEIVTGLQYLNPQAPTREDFAKDAKALRAELAALTAQPDTPAAAKHAVESLDEVIAETEKEQPVTRRVINRLRETLEFITDAGKALDTAHKAAPLITKAIGTATILYTAAAALF